MLYWILGSLVVLLVVAMVYVHRVGEPLVRVECCRSKLHVQPCWHGYCAKCGKSLTAFASYEESCRRVGESALKEHTCG